MKTFLILLLVISFRLNGEEKNLSENFIFDSSIVNVRIPDPDSINVFRNDEAFNYDENQEASNIFDFISLWFEEFLRGIFGQGTYDFIMEYIGYIVVIAAIIIVVIVLNRSRIRGIFYGSKESPVSNLKEIKEDINELDFDELISEYLQKKEYRIAVRYYYLKTLKLLSDKKLIDLQINKTNSVYIREIKKPELKRTFGDLTYLFEYIWYGDVKIEEDLFEKTRKSFNNFILNLESAK